jgi:hypothetical protein
MTSDFREDWYWAAWSRGGAAGDRFVIAYGQDEMWARVRREISADERCAWMPLHRGGDKAKIEHILHLILCVVPMYQVNHNRFMFEAAKIPAFAKWLRYSARADLCNYVSNPVSRDAIAPAPYSDKEMRHLGGIVNATLGIDDDWF